MRMLELVLLDVVGAWLVELTGRAFRDGRDMEALRSWRTFMVRDLGSLLLGSGGGSWKWSCDGGGVFSSWRLSRRGRRVAVELVLRVCRDAEAPSE